MARNINSPYARFTKDRLSDAQWYVVSPSGTAQYADLGNIFPPDAEDGIPRVYTSVASVFSQANAIVSGRGDKIFLTPDYTTALTAGDLLNCETNGVTVVHLGPQQADGVYAAYRATATLPQTTHSAIFTVTGRVKILDIIGVVTTAVQNQANNTKLTSYPTAAGLSSVDICSVTDIANAPVATILSITGTFATALVKTTNGALVYQASPTIVEAGAIHLDCASSNTGSVKWAVRYVPLDPGAKIIAA